MRFELFLKSNVFLHTFVKYMKKIGNDAPKS